MNTSWHFPVMIFASLLFFLAVIRVILSFDEFRKQTGEIITLSLLVVVFGMLMGKFGIYWGFPWWIYYTVPMLITVILPPVILKMNKKQIIWYLILSILAAPFIHIFFSFFFAWKEYLPFWHIASLKSLLV